MWVLLARELGVVAPLVPEGVGAVVGMAVVGVEAPLRVEMVLAVVVEEELLLSERRKKNEY